MKIITNYDKIENDLYDVCHLFYPECKQDDLKPHIYHKMTINKNIVFNEYKVVEEETEYEFSEQRELKPSYDSLEEKRQIKRFAKLTLYKMFSKHFDKNLPWGSLTGIRPTKIGYDLLNQGVEQYFLTEALMENFLVSKPKALLVQRVIQNQKCIIRNDKLVDLYINIPFCLKKEAEEYTMGFLFDITFVGGLHQCRGWVCQPETAVCVILYLQNETKIARNRYLRKRTEAVKDKDYKLSLVL